MTANHDQQLERIRAALGAMSRLGPRDLRSYLQKPGPDFADASAGDIEALVCLLLDEDPNQPGRLEFSLLLRGWDNAKDVAWTQNTSRNTSERRTRIHELLKSGPSLTARIDQILPFYRIEEPLVIAEEHKEWYSPTPGKDYYWETYLNFLRERKGWDQLALLSMDNATRSIVERFSCPSSSSAYSSKGLVVGYVQSGKTANFTGVVARAADAGYRLIIILAGTWDILRNQTQRRIDKELLGKELLANDESYKERRPADWDEFLEHGFNPRDHGHYDWQRLTRPDLDFKRLRAAIENLEFDRRDRSKPLYDPANLLHLPVKLLVVKKHHTVLENLVKDLKLLETRLQELPSLVIDDESDQAGINTLDPRKPPSNGEQRTSTNRAIVKLLKLLPRAQYVGYTATPYANALIPTGDGEDLFPKDFIVSLDRPAGYMGVSDFFDPTTAYEDLDASDATLPEIAFLRRVSAPHGQDDDDLKTALRSYVLAGAVKMFRAATGDNRYRKGAFDHHTMLVHTSSSKGEHGTLADRIKEIWDACAFNSPKGLIEVEKLWSSDYERVCKAQGQNELTPASFWELHPYLAQAVQRITADPKFIRVVNSDKDEAPDFSAGPVWKIIVGGNKLSRGYTVEGLTVSYYRRVSNNADTLMQMGRWFGFRPGYRDLVRVFIGIVEGKKADVDLITLYKQACLMEERFREEITRYVRQPGHKRVTPKQIPPLIALFGNLPPTARNKMFHTTITGKNFSGEWAMPTLMPSTDGTLKGNIATLATLLQGAKSPFTHNLGGTTESGKKIDAVCRTGIVTNAALIKFLEAFRWIESDYKSDERPQDIALQLEFLGEQKHGITSWLIMAPQMKTTNSLGEEPFPPFGNFSVKERARAGNRGFGVIGESDHRSIAGYLTGIEPAAVSSRLTHPNQETKALRDDHRGVALIYLVKESTDKLIPAVGFELLFPANDLGHHLHVQSLPKPVGK